MAPCTSVVEVSAVRVLLAYRYRFRSKLARARLLLSKIKLLQAMNQPHTGICMSSSDDAAVTGWQSIGRDSFADHTTIADLPHHLVSRAGDDSVDTAPWH